jgi:hypothetical protein
MRKLCLALTVTLISIMSYAALVDEASQSFQTPTTRTVSGTRIGHYKNGPVPVDLSTTTIGAFAPNGAGGYTFLSGTGTSTGTFTIANVPSGFYLLQLGGLYLWTKNTAVDGDFYTDYRSDTVQADQNTTFTFDLTNLNTWQTTDFFEVLCPNNVADDFFPGTVGETVFIGTFQYFGPLSVASEGDQYYIEQLITQNVGGYPFTALGRYVAPAKFTQAQGSDMPINGRLKTIAQNHAFEANINGADLTAQALAANPGGTLVGTSAGLGIYPGSLAKGASTAAPDLVIYGGVPSIVTNGDLGQVAYGNPFPSKWPLFSVYDWLAQTNYTAPGATNSTPILTFAVGIDTTLPTSSNPIKPLVGVVGNPSINHKNFFVDRVGVGTTPTLRWSPPSVGSATFYSIQIFLLANNGGNTTKKSIAMLYSPRPSLLLPGGLLSTGQAYVFRIRSWYVPGLDFAKTPFVLRPTHASADVISGVMQP